MRFTTVNVNGIRAAIRKGMGPWVEEESPDILALQEVRAPATLVSDLLPGSWQIVESESVLKGRAGVAIALGEGAQLLAERHGLDGENPVDTGRWVEADVRIGQTELTVVSAYLHSGEKANEEKMAAKYRHLDMVSARLDELNDGRHLIMAGDFNVVRSEKDIKNFKPNHNKTSGVLDEEMAYLAAWFDTYADVHRHVEGDVQGPYTWWSWRGRAFDNNAGWRIDYQLADHALAGVASNARVFRATGHDTRWSDHAPLSIDYELGNLPRS